MRIFVFADVEKRGQILRKTVGFFALNLKLIYFDYLINLCFDDNKSDFFY